MTRYIIALVLLLLTIATLSLAAPSVKVTPDVIDDPDMMYKVSWDGIPDPQVGDALTIHLVPRTTTIFPVPDGPAKKTLGFYFVAEHDLAQTGKGVVDVPVYLTRDMAFYFEFTRIDKKSSTVLAYSQLLAQNTHYLCSHFHLATTHKANEMLIQYVTSQSQKEVQAVQVSTDKTFAQNVLVFNATDNNLAYTTVDMFESPAIDDKFFIDPGRFREALLVNLQPNTEYFYRIMKADGGQISKLKSFISAPVPGSSTAETDLYIFGDLGVGVPFYTTLQQQPPSVKTTNAIFSQLQDQIKLNANLPNGKKRHSSLLLIGDLSYARGYASFWEYWFKQIEPIAERIPFHVTIGNHEYDYLQQKWKPDWSDFKQDSGGEGGVPTFRRFKSPDDWHITPYGKNDWYSDDNTKDYIARKERSISYSYDSGQVHIIVFSAEHDFTKGSSQYQFIEKDLKNIDRTVTPWVIMTSHRPMYCSSSGCSIAPDSEPKGMDWRLRQALEGLLTQYRVHLYVAGHNHHYARSSMITHDYEYIDSPDVVTVKDGVSHIKYQGAPIHLLTGASGNPFEPPYQPYMPMVKNFTPVFHHVTPEWLEFRTMSFGYSHIYANKTHLVQTFYGNQRAGLIHDKFVLVNP